MSASSFPGVASPQAWAALDALVRFDAATGRVVRMMDGSTSAMQQVVAAVRNADAALCEALEPYCGVPPSAAFEVLCGAVMAN